MAVILLTGAAGFIASRVAAQLLDQGHTVVGVDNLNDAYDPRLKRWRLSQIAGRERFRFYEADVCDLAALDGIGAQCPGIEAVINLAARAGVRQSTENPWVYVDTNVTGTLNLLEFCRRQHIGKFILASTSSLYGKNNSLPYREDADTNQPLSPYAATKKAAEALCFTYHHLYGLDVSILRYFTVYGPAGRPDMSVLRFVQWIQEGRPVTIYGDGSQSRDFTYVDDIARGTILALKSLGCQVLNLGSDRPWKLIDVLQAVEKLVGRKAEIRFEPAHAADVDATWADITCARQILGWQPQYTCEEGLSNVVAWYRENRDWAREIDTR